MRDNCLWTVQNQEGELESLRAELQQLREEETGLESQIESSRSQLNQLTASHTQITTQVAQVRTGRSSVTLVTQLVARWAQLYHIYFLFQAKVNPILTNSNV